MANGGQVNYSIKFNVDKTSLTALNKELTQIQLQAAEMAKSPKGLTEELKKASDAASVLQDALNSSWNEKLNQINLNKFNTTLKNSGTTAQDLMQKLATGPASAQNAFNDLTRSLVTTNVHLKTTSKILDSFAITFKNTIRYGISSSIFNNLSNSISKAYDYSVKLDKSLNDIRIVSDKSAADMDRFAISANKAAKELGRSTLDYTKASTIFFQQGLDDVDVEARTQATLKAANVTGQSGEAVSEQLTAVWNGYKVSAAETELYVDKLAAVAASTAADLEELSTGMSKVASAANIMGVDIDQLNAQLATVVSVTRQAPESVGVAFKTIYARMGDIKAGLDDEVTLGNYTEKMANLGINVLDANNNLRDMGEVIEEIGGKWGTMSREQQMALAQIMAGQRQYNNLLSLFDNWDMYTEALNTSKKAAGELQREQDIYMETTQAHLQQLSTEAERTYAILFDKKTVNGFYDSSRVLLDEFNDWIEGLGGGFNAIINLASQLGIVFRKQIGDSLLRNIDNVKNWWYENKVNLGLVKETSKVYEELSEKLRKERAKSSLQAQNLPAYLQVNTTNQDGDKENLYLAERNKHTNELIEKNKELLKVKNYVSDESFNEVQNNLSDVAALKDKVSEYETIKKYAKEKGLDTEDKFTAQITGAENGLKRIQNEYNNFDDIITTVRGNLEGVSRQQNESLGGSEKWVEMQKESYQDALNIYDDLLLQAKDLGLINEEQYQQKIEEAQFNKIFAIDSQDQEQAKIAREKLIADALILKNQLAKQYNDLLREGKTIEEAMDDETVKNIQKQIDEKQAQIDNTLNQGSKSKAAAGVTSTIMGLTQAATAAVGAFKVLTQDGVSAAERLNAGWSGVTGSIAGIANMIAPGSGFLIQGVAELGKGILEVTGLWDKWADSMKSSAERLQEHQENIQKIREEVKKANDELEGKKQDYKESTDTLKEFQKIKDRFEYLQDLANKGLLTDELRDEYEGYLQKVQKYNKEAIISYDQQGNLISTNTKLMDETIAKLEKINQENYSNLYSAESWRQGKTAATGYAREAEERYESEIDWGTQDWRTNYRTYDSEGRESSEIPDLMNKLNHIENYINDEDALNRDLKRLETLMSQAPTVTTDKSGLDDKKAFHLHDGSFLGYTELGGNSFETYEYNRRNALDRANSAYKTKQEELARQQLDSSFLYNHLVYNKDKNNEYNALAQTMGAEQTQEFLQNYINGIQDELDDYLDDDGILDYDSLAERIQKIQKDLSDVFRDNLNLQAAIMSGIKNTKNGEYKTSQEYEDAVIEEMKNLLPLIENEDQFKKLMPALATLYGLDSTAGFEWDAKNNKATFGNNNYNVVTKGEAKARTIGETLGVSEEDKSYIENYLQSILSEEQLANLDVATFNQAFNRKIFNEALALDPEYADYVKYKELTAKKLAGTILPDEKTLLASIEEKYGKLNGSIDTWLANMANKKIALPNLDKILSGTLKQAGIDTSISGATKSRAKEFGFNEAAIKAYVKYLQKLKPALKDDQAAAEKLAISMIELDDALNAFAEKWEDWEEILKDPELKNTPEYFKAAGDAAEGLSDIFGAEVSPNFFDTKENLKDIDKMLNGDVDAFYRLREAVAQDFVANLNLNEADETYLLDKIDELNSKDIEIGTSISELDDGDFIKTLNGMIDAGKITADQANEYLSSIGYEGEIGYKDGPETTTETKVTGNVLGKEITLATLHSTSTTQVPYIKDARKKDDGNTINHVVGSGGKGRSNKNKGKGGGSGGKSSEPKKIDKTEDESDRYHKIDTQIEKTSNNLDKLEKAEEKALGGDWVKNLTQQFQQLNNQIANYNEKLKIAKGEQSELRSELAKAGVSFNADGTISNYNAAFDAQLKKLNDLEDQYNHLSAKQQEKWDENKTIDKAKEDFNKFKENMDRYDELVSSFIPDLQKEIQDAIDQMVEKQIEKFNKGIDLRLDMAEAERDWNEFKTKVIDGIDEDDIIGQTQAKINDFATYYDTSVAGSIVGLTKHLNDIMAEMNKKVSNVYGKDDVKELEDLRKYYEELMDEMEGVFDLQKEIHEAYLDMMDEAQEKFDEQIEAYETVSDLIEHDMSLIELIYGEGAYTELGKFYDKQAENNKNQLDFQRQQVEFWKAQMDGAEEASDEWENAKEKWVAATADLNDLIEASIENLQDKYLNAIEEIFDKLNDEVTKGKGLDFIDTEWQLINKEADQYLDTINQLFETQALENKYLDAIDQTDNIAAQRKLKDLMDEELAALKEKDKLTQYDIERANKRYEIALKQIALEEAQQNKSTMRLRRDSQGNYRYEYVADNDAIDQARDELEKLKNDLYNFDKAQYEESLGEMYDTWVEYQDALKEAAQINDPEERAAKEALIKEKYGDIINNMLAENDVIRQNLEQSAFEDLALLYDKNLEDYTNMTDAEKDALMNDLVPAWQSGVQDMINTMVGEGGFYPVCDEAFMALEQEQDELSEGFKEIEDAANQTFGSIAEGVDSAIDETKQLIADNNDLTTSYQERLDVMKGLGDQIDSLADSFKKAGDAAENTIKKVHDLLHEIDLETAEAYDDAATAATKDKTVPNAVNGNPQTTTTNTSSNTSNNTTASSSATNNPYSGYRLGGQKYTIKSGDTLSGIAKRYYGSAALYTEIWNHNKGRLRGKNANQIWPGEILYLNTGGYTGDWSGNNGRVAMLHQKELVLNATDTENMLNAINVMRNLTNSVGIATLARLASLGAGGSAGIGGNGLEQNVHISATFPNATSTREIEEALLNLTNRASQMIGRR